MDGVAGQLACSTYSDADGYVQDTGREDYQEMSSDDGQKWNDIIDVIEPVIDDLAIFFGVSRLAAKIRMVDAGYEEARGAFIYIDGRYVTPHRYKKDSIGEDQTFSIGAEDAAI